MFKVGDEVTYGMHGRCLVTAIETKNVQGNTLEFYELKAVKALPSAAGQKVVLKSGPAIMIPVQTAKRAGLRAPINSEESTKLLENMETMAPQFDPSLNSQQIQKKIEDNLRTEGAIGLAEAIVYLHQMRKNNPTMSQALIRFNENLKAVFAREIADALSVAAGEALTAIENALQNRTRKRN